MRFEQIRPTRYSPLANDCKGRGPRTPEFFGGKDLPSRKRGDASPSRDPASKDGWEVEGRSDSQSKFCAEVYAFGLNHFFFKGIAQRDEKHRRGMDSC